MTEGYSFLFSFSQVHHKYYVSQIINSGKDYWVDVQGNPDHEEHYKLSDSYLLRKVFLFLCIKYCYQH